MVATSRRTTCRSRFRQVAAPAPRRRPPAAANEEEAEAEAAEEATLSQAVHAPPQDPQYIETLGEQLAEFIRRRTLVAGSFQTSRDLGVRR